LLQGLRAAGFTCPTGTYFPPNDAEFVFDCRLWRAALEHSQDMGSRNYFSHITPEGADPFDRSKATGLATFYENIAAGVESAAATLEQFKTSGPHCENMMAVQNNRVGVAHAFAGGSTYRHYWTQMFANDGGDADHSCLPPISLRTHQAVERSSGPPRAHVAALVPPFAVPAGAAARTAAARQQVQAQKAQPALKSHALALGRASAADLEGFFLLQGLRAAGFTCPTGTYFPPNDAEFVFDCRLWRAALEHSQDMGSRNYFSHITPEGADPFDRSKATGLATFYENIAAGVESAAATLEQFKTSGPHCENMMAVQNNRVGVAHAFAGGSTYRHYWTQMFANDGGDADHSCLP